MAKVPTAIARSIAVGVAVGPQYITDQLLAKADVIRAKHERVQLCQDPQTEFVFPSRKSWCQPHQPRTASARPHDPAGTAGCRNLRRGWTAISREARIGYKRARDIVAVAHLGAPTAAKPRLQVIIQDGVAAVTETAISTFLGAVDDGDKATTKLNVQKAAHTADESWQQTIGGLQEPSVTTPTVSDLEHPNSASQDEDS